jgi:hypothetical protein
MLAREEARLRSLFHQLLLVSAAASPLACSSTPAEAPAKGDTSPDATTEPPVSRSDDAGADATLVSDGAPDKYGFTSEACDPSAIDGSVDDAGCDFLVSLPCGLPPVQLATSGCHLEVVTCAALCGQQANYNRTCTVVECTSLDASAYPDGGPGIPDSGSLTLDCQTGVCAANSSGRRPAGLCEARPASSSSAVGDHLAAQAWLEAASVHAFRCLGDELAGMGAPRALVRAARRSARDEVRHARAMTRHAQRYGAHPARVCVARTKGRRPLEAFAIENAVEGCVRESFGALLARHQAQHAPDPQLARTMKPIAADETRHAALAWAIARWVEPRLTSAERARVRNAVDGALDGLRRELANASPALASALGLPHGQAARALVRAFEGALFASGPKDSLAEATRPHAESPVGN